MKKLGFWSILFFCAMSVFGQNQDTLKIDVRKKYCIIFNHDNAIENYKKSKIEFNPQELKMFDELAKHYVDSLQKQYEIIYSHSLQLLFLKKDKPFPLNLTTMANMFVGFIIIFDGNAINEKFRYTGYGYTNGKLNQVFVTE